MSGLEYSPFIHVSLRNICNTEHYDKYKMWQYSEYLTDAAK